MILVYESTETAFNTLGLGTITPSAASVIEEHNGQYKVSITHPIDEDGNWQKLKRGRIVVVPTHDGPQPFRLYKPYINTDTGFVDVSGVHIFYDLYDNFIEDTRPTVKDGQDAGDAIIAGMQYPTPHTFESDVTAVNNAYYIRKNPVEAFIGSEDNAFKNRWPSVIKRDGYRIIMNSRRGSDKGFRIAFRKNLVGVEMSDDDSRVVTRIRPIALDQNGVVFTTDQVYFDSPLINSYPHPKISELDTGIRVGQEAEGSVPYPDITSAKTAMAQMVLDTFASGIDKPEMTLRVRFVDLGDTEEYGQFKDLITANMDDDVIIEHLDLGMEIKARVVYIEWDGLRNRANEIVLGNVIPNYANTAVAKDIDISALKNNMNTTLRENEVYNGMHVNHSDGFMTIAEIDNHTIRTKQNSQTGFAIYDGETFIGGVQVVNGKVLLKGNAVETSAVIDGKTISVKVNPSEGLGIYDGTTFIGGAKVIDNKVVIVSNLLTNNIDGESYAVIGDVDISGVTNRGILVYNKTVSETEPTLKILTSKSTLADGTSGGFLRVVTFNGAELWMGRSNNLTFRVIDLNQRTRISVDYLAARLFSPNGNNIFYINDTGVYKQIGSTTTQL